MKKIYILITLFIILLGFFGYAGKIENDYLGASIAAQQTAFEDLLSERSPQSLGMDQRQLLTIGILLGAGLVGLLIIRRK
jgi:hypothetical protein